MTRTFLAAALAATALLLSAAGASASTLSLSGTTLTYQAATGEANYIYASLDNATHVVEIVDSGSVGLNPVEITIDQSATTCTYVDDNDHTLGVDCSGVGTTITASVTNLDDLADSFNSAD